VDAVRAYAIVGVVLGHWLVTGLVLAPDGSLRTASPLRAMPELAPVTWLFQTLGLFFFLSGYASARSLDSAHGRGHDVGWWLRRRLGRLVRPVGALLGVGTAVLAGAAVLGVPGTTLRTAGTLLVSPLWFLLPLTVLVALTGPLARALRRHGPLRLTAPAVVLVAITDLAGRLGDGPGSGGWRVPMALLAAWLVPYLLGMALATDRLGTTGTGSGDGPTRRTGWFLLLGGAAGMAGLVLVGGYPVSAVGIPGAGRSNLDPPSLFTVCLALAQVGAALLLRPALGRRLASPRRWRPVARLTAAAPRIYLWHQGVLLGVTALAALGAGLVGSAGVPGLHTAPDGPGWIVARLAWLPLFALVLGALVGRPADGPAPRSPEQPAGRIADSPDRPRRFRGGDRPGVR
jgi:hypothetical protein